MSGETHQHALATEVLLAQAGHGALGALGRRHHHGRPHAGVGGGALHGLLTQHVVLIDLQVAHTGDVSNKGAKWRGRERRHARTLPPAFPAPPKSDVMPRKRASTLLTMALITAITVALSVSTKDLLPPVPAAASCNDVSGRWWWNKNRRVSNF